MLTLKTMSYLAGLFLAAFAISFFVVKIVMGQNAQTIQALPEVHKFESFTAQEGKDYVDALKHLHEVEARIRKAHGESTRFSGNEGPGFTITTADCKIVQTTIEILDDGVLVTTRYAGVEGNPTCF